jgi:hypothetical protein
MRTGRKRWFAAAGVVLGLGLYTYNVYPAFVLAFAGWVGVYTWLHRRGAEFRPWARNVALAAVVAFIVGLPMFAFIATNRDEYFQHYDQYYEQYSVLASAEYRRGSTATKAEAVGSQVLRFIGAYAWEGTPDLVDGAAPNGRPLLDVLTLWFALVGAAYCLLHRRSPPYLLCICLFVVLPLPGLLQTNATYRGPLALAPFLCFLVALPLAMAWRAAAELRAGLGRAFRAAVLLTLASIAFLNLQAYFSDWASSRFFDRVYARDFSEAMEYVRDLPDRPYVYLLSERISFDHETRLFLAPRLAGEDRSLRFSGVRDLDFPATRRGAVVLLDAYTRGDTLDELQRRYPGGEAHLRLRHGGLAFAIYRLPDPERVAPP